MVSDTLALLPEHVHLGERCAWHGTVAACEGRGTCSACREGFSGCSGVCSNNLWPAKQAVRCDFCDALDLNGREGAKCPECPKGLMWPASSALATALAVA